MNISFHFLIFICAIYSHFTGRRGGGKFPPLLCCLYLQIHKYFFPFSKFLSCVIFSFLKFTIISFHLLFLAFSLGEIFPKYSDVSSLLTGGKFPPTCALYICRCMIISFHSLIFICAIYIHFTGGGGGGGGRFLPLLSFLYLQIHNYFHFHNIYHVLFLARIFSLSEIPPRTKARFQLNAFCSWLTKLQGMKNIQTRFRGH